jgi:hypothetical protein
MDEELQLDYQIIDSTDGEEVIAPDEVDEVIDEEDQDNPGEGEPGEADGDGVEDEDDPDTAGEEEGQAPAKKPVKFDAEQQKVFNDEIAKKAKIAREAERRAEEAERRLAQLEEAHRPARPDVPELPDPFQVTDTEFKQAVQARDKALQDAAVYDSQQKSLESQRKALQEQQQAAQFEQLKSTVSQYVQRAESAGIDRTVLEGAGAIVGGELPWIQGFVLSDKYGPQVVQYLAANPQERSKLAEMNPEQRAFYLGSTVRNKAAASVKPKVSGAPAPSSKPLRSGSVEVKGLPGAKIF